MSGRIVNRVRAHDVCEDYVRHVIHVAVETNADATDTARAREEIHVLTIL